MYANTFSTIVFFIFYFYAFLKSTKAVYVNLAKLNSRLYIPFNERNVDLLAWEKIENGILPNEQRMARSNVAMLINGRLNKFVGADQSFPRVIKPHTRVRDRAVIPYQQPKNMSGTIRFLSPFVDRHLLYSMGDKVASDCEQGFCQYLKHKRGGHISDDTGIVGFSNRSYRKNYISNPEKYKVFDGFDLRGYPLFRTFDIDHMVNDMPPDDSDNRHYHYHAGHYEELFSAISNPLRPTSKRIHVMRPTERNYDSDPVSNYTIRT